MDQKINNQIRESLDGAQSVAIALGRNPKLDDMASALSLYLTLSHAGKRASVLTPTEPIVELSNLVGIDRVRTSYEGDGGDLVVSFPYKEGEIEKVSYTIDNGFLNIVVKAGEEGLSFTENDVRYRRSGGAIDLIMTIGLPRLSDLGNVIPEDILQQAKIINIDNKPHNQNYGDIVHVSPKYSSVSEQVTELLLDMGMDPDVDAAQNLLSGISSATNNFQSPRTSFVAFEMAAYLMRKGAVRSASVAGGQAQPQPQLQSQPQPRNEDRIRQELQRAAQEGQQRPQNQQSRDQRQQQRGQNRPQRDHQGGNQQFQQQRGQQFGGQQQRAQRDQHFDQPSQPSQAQQHNDFVDDVPVQDDQKNPPTEWLTPKVYKGSSNI